MSQNNSYQYNFCTLNQQNTSKPLPSLDFISKLIDICYMPNTLFESQQRNLYDRKNHILYINNYNAYKKILEQKYSRTVYSFEKQMKMIGFKKKYINQHNTMNKTINNTMNSNNKNIINDGNITKQFNANPNPSQSNINIPKQAISQPYHISPLNQSIPNPQPQSLIQCSPKYMFMFKTNRSLLIQKQLIRLQQQLQQRIQSIMLIKQAIIKRKNKLIKSYKLFY